MTKKIFQSILWVSSVLFLIGFLMITWLLYDHFADQLREELKKETAYLTEGVRLEGTGYLEAVADHDDRITLIAPDGTVLYDSKADIARMENHGGREEVLEALEQGEGDAIRDSDTMLEKTVYYAKRLENGQVLRIASTQLTVGALVGNLLPPILLILAVMIVASALVAHGASRKIVSPLNQLDLERPEKNDTYEEVAPLLEKLSRQQRTIENQLRDAKRQQQEFSMITDNMKEGLLVIDGRGELLSWNRSAVKLLGGGREAEGVSLTRQQERGLREIIRSALKGNHQDRVKELEGRMIRVIASPVQHGELVEGCVLLLADVTEKIQREELRREFTANVSHELKTPLTSISGYAELLQEGMVRPEDVSGFGGRIFGEAQRLITLVNDIIGISQLDEGDLPYEQETVELRALGREILERLAPAARAGCVELRTEGEPVLVRAVRKVLDEVICNLCDNAIKYNREGGQVTVTTGLSEGRPFLSVKDNGIGISPEHQRRVFERFYRVDKSHSRAIGGTGLGLSIVKHGAAYLGAEVSLYSREGEGSEFLLTFKKAVDGNPEM